MDAQGVPIQPKSPEYGFTVSHQLLELEVDFSTQSLTGRTTLTILPLTRDLREIKIDARQCSIRDGQVLVDGKVAEFDYEDPMKLMDVPPFYVWNANQHKMMKDRSKPLTEQLRGDGPLVIIFPKGVRVDEADAAGEVIPRVAPARSSSMALDGTNVPLSAVSTLPPKIVVEQAARYQPMNITISFTTKRFRDGLHFVGLGEGDARFPHVYTKHSMDPGIASCIFPCIDDPAMRCTWEISIKSPRTLGDALRKQPLLRDHKSNLHHLLYKKGLTNGVAPPIAEEHEIPLSDEEKLLEMTIVCSGDLMNETIDLDDSTKKVTSFLIQNCVAPQHVGFAIGPFEQVDLSEFREVEDDEKLGQGQTLPVLGFCLPGRADEVRHTCTPLAHALDYFLLTYGTYPSKECKFVFVDDQVREVEHTLSLSICSTRLLFSEDIIDPEIDVVRTLVHAIATQWLGVLLVPEKPADRWVTIGLSYWMTDLFMKSLCGHNEYSFRQKVLTDKLVKLDVERPSLHALGPILSLGAFEHDFMTLKAPLVMFILDRRFNKASGSVGLERVLSRIIVQANTGASSDSVLSTEGFRRWCEKVTKYRQTEQFWVQWVLGAGCPKLSITQKFNKKRLCVEVTITQKNELAPQNPAPPPKPLERASFMREFKEDVEGVYAGEIQPFFTGPMTIRIHEADGTPYEHIIDIKDGNSKIEIPYNTKYKRLKRKNLQRQRQAGGIGISGEGSDEALYYCLGDVLQSREDMQKWGLSEWNEDAERAMDLESYEWIRVDADFEWLCEKTFVGMPAYMYISQLQQDRDVVAQQESMLYLETVDPNALSSTFLLRTIMDRRYFHGIRQLAAEILNRHSVPSSNWSGLRHLEKAYQALFCYDGGKMPRSNDFGDKRAYKLEMAMVRGFARMRDTSGKCPKDARVWLLDILRFNDNTNNEFSDYFKIANLLSALTDSIIIKEDPNRVVPDPTPEEQWEYDGFVKSVVDELDRYRRMDEWINSYQNIFTVTVLDSKQRLMKAKVIPHDPVEFAQYLHDGTSDFVRIKAFESLVELGLMHIPSVASLLLNVMSTDPSPYMREHLLEIFCLGLAIFAFGDVKSNEATSTKPSGQANALEGPEPVVNGDMDIIMEDVTNGAVNGASDINGDGGLIVEEDISLEGRKADVARTTTIEGALKALKEELRHNEALKEALWKAVKSHVISLHEQTTILQICGILYEAMETLCIRLRKPKYWKAVHLGKVSWICPVFFISANSRRVCFVLGQQTSLEPSRSENRRNHLCWKSLCSSLM
jgi:transcription initiation factor TFIID subunit 2